MKYIHIQNVYHYCGILYKRSHISRSRPRVPTTPAGARRGTGTGTDI